jgi:hypothetical protein
MIFSVGVIVGFWVSLVLGRKAHAPSGTILVTQSEQTTLYSLELDDYPESIALKKEVVFKVDASGRGLNRK